MEKKHAPTKTSFTGKELPLVPLEPRRTMALRREKCRDFDAMIEAIAIDGGEIDADMDEDARFNALQQLKCEVRDKTYALEEINGREAWEWLLDFLCRIARGDRNADARKACHLSPGMVYAARQRCKLYNRLWLVADNCRLASVLPDVFDAAVDLAINGDETTHYNASGCLLKKTRKRDVRAIEMLMKAGDKRFRDQKNDAGDFAGGITYNIQMLGGFSGQFHVPDPKKARPEVIDIKEEDVKVEVADAPKRETEFS